MRPKTFLTGLIAVIVALLLMAQAVFAAPRILSESGTFVFHPADKIRLTVEGAERGSTWRVRGHGGKLAASGAFDSGGRQPVTLPALGYGHFTFSVTPGQSGPAVEAPFAIVPPRARPSAQPRFGVMTHYAHGWTPDSIPLVAAANLGFVRDELYWQEIERTPGQYTFPESYDRYMRELRQRGIAPLIVLSFANKLYDNGETPYSDRAITAYARYALAVLRHYGPQIKAVEIWNEYNGSFATGPAAADRARTYTRMLRTVYRAIKRVRPDVTVIGGATAGVPLPYWEKLCRYGALRSMDAVSIHPYRYNSTPEGLEDSILQLRTLLARYHKGPEKPIWATEFGWAIRQPAAPGDLAVGEAEKAKFLVRGSTLLLAGGVDRLCWYLLKDHTAPMGLLEGAPPYHPKPAYVSYATMVRTLDGATFVRREPAGGGVRSYLFRRGGTDVRVMWAAKPTDVAFKDRSLLLAINLLGASVRATARDGNAVVRLTDHPIYVVGSELRPLLPAPDPEERLLADAAAGFSSVQGKNGWRYGYSSGPGHFVPFTQYRTTDWRAEWGGDVAFLAVSASSLHPARLGETTLSAVRRWTSAVEGKVRIDGSWRSLPQGDGVTARILVDGSVASERQLGGGAPIAAEFSLAADVRAGSTIDFLVDPGANMDFDDTELSARITLIGGDTR
jgi:hypothetical protein